MIFVVTSRPTLRRKTLLVFALLFGLLATACGSAATETQAQTEVSESSATEGARLSGEYDTVSGETVQLSSFEGSNVVLWFWAPW